MLEVYKQFWKSYIDFSGRTTRKEWWIVIAIDTFISLLWIIPALLAFVFSSNDGGVFDFPMYGIIAIIIGILYELASFIPGIAMWVRRLRDAGFHWALIFVQFVPYVGGLALFILMQFPTKNLFDGSGIPNVEG